VFRSRRTKQFNALLAALPADVQKQAHQAYKQFMQNPRRSSLRFKCVDDSEEPPWYSIRIGARFRALATVEGDLVSWFWIGTHAEYNKLI
jgi:hypothetical protein